MLFPVFQESRISCLVRRFDKTIKVKSGFSPVSLNSNLTSRDETDEIISPRSLLIDRIGSGSIIGSDKKVREAPIPAIAVSVLDFPGVKMREGFT